MRLSLPVALALYAAFIVLVALAAVFYLPNSGEIGFNAKASTALLSGGTAAGLMLLWAFLLHRGKNWAWAAAVVTGLGLIGVFSWRAQAGWSAYYGGQSDKWYAASLISLMAVATLFLVGHLVWYRRR